MLCNPIHKIATAMLQFSSVLVAAYPVQDTKVMTRNDAQPVNLDEAPGRRTIIVVFCIGYVFLLALAQGNRAMVLVFDVLARLTNTSKAIAQVVWPARRHARGSLTFSYSHKVSSVPLSYSLSVSIQQDWVSRQMRSVMQRYGYASLCTG